jgi:8-oxo-dGTP diphosphatase
MEDTQSPQNIDLEVRVVVFSLRDDRLQVLLVPAEANQSPSPWTIPGSQVQPGISLEETAARCVARFTPRHRVYLEQLYTYGDPTRSPDRRLISVVYFALIPAGAFQPRGESGPAGWFPVDELPELAMDGAEVLSYALRRLRYKLEYSAVGFELLSEAFTLTELQHTYEIILGESLDKRNFRRRILAAGIIEPAGGYRSGEGRPAQLYRYNPDAVAEVKARRLFP